MPSSSADPWLPAATTGRSVWKAKSTSCRTATSSISAFQHEHGEPAAVTPSVLVIVPTYNERANLALLIPALMRHPALNLLVVDDQSPDGTGELAESLGRRHIGRIDVMRRQGPRGFGRSYVDGMKRALDGPYDVICQMDADLSHDPAHLADLIAATSHADVVI